MTRTNMIRSNDCVFRLAATRGVQAGRVYYMTTVRMSYLRRLVAFDAGDVLERSQREVERTRVKKIAAYITNSIDASAFYVLPALTGTIDRYEFEPVDASSQHAGIGTLAIPLDATLSLFDGQHRAAAIIEACKKADVDDDISILLYPQLTLSERKQAFADINDNAKKPSKALSVTYNKRDGLSDAAVRLSQECCVFEDRVDYEKNLVRGNSGYSFSIKALKDSLQKMFGLKAGQTISEEQYQQARAIYEAWGSVLGYSLLVDMSAQEFRERYISAHGVMLQVIARATKRWLDVSTLDATLASISALGFDEERLTAEYWKKILVCPQTGRVWATKAAIEDAANHWLDLALGQHDASLKAERAVDTEAAEKCDTEHNVDDLDSHALENVEADDYISLNSSVIADNATFDTSTVSAAQLDEMREKVERVANDSVVQEDVESFAKLLVRRADKKQLLHLSSLRSLARTLLD